MHSMAAPPKSAAQLRAELLVDIARVRALLHRHTDRLAVEVRTDAQRGAA